MIINGDYDIINKEFYITISAHIPELKSIINITKKSYLVDFAIENSIGPTLGFCSETSKQSKIGYGYNKSTNIVDIIKIKKVLVNVDIITGSYVNGKQSPCIYSFDPYKVPPGYKLDDYPKPTLIYYPVNRTNINNLRIWLTDEEENSLNLQGEEITISLEIREKVSIKQEIVSAIKQLKKENIL